MKVEYKKVILIGLIVLVVLGTTFLVQATVDSGKRYSLSLCAKQHFSAITLTACLTVTGERNERGRTSYDKEDVAGALICFYTCTSAGRILKEIGHSVTGHDGTATFCWSVPSNGNYWFIATYTVNDKIRNNSHFHDRAVHVTN
ncbi:MAG: hypothetical protein ABR962_06640 [Candidatus Bathyarchaeia archaeon]|jgi:hypothetical protein